MQIKDKYKLPLLLGLIKCILPYVLQDGYYELHRDEYLYLAQGDHLSWGFMEVPPLLAVLAKFTHLGGGSFFLVKFWPAFFGGLTVMFSCLLCSELGGRRFAQFITGLCLLTGVYLRIHFLFQPNFLEIFWWTVTAYLLARYINTKRPGFLLLVGVAIGLGWLSKYSILLFASGIFVGCLLTPQRKWLLQKHIYIAAAVALLIALPNLAWQYFHRWPVLHHMRELRETQLQYVSPADFLKDQLLMNLPCLFVWIAGLCWLLFSRTAKPYRLLGWVYLTVIALLLISSGKNYYSLGAYPMLFAAGAVSLEAASATRFKWIRYASAALILLLSIPFIPLALPIWKPSKLAAFYRNWNFDKTGALKWEDLKNHPLPQDFADMTGWKELAAKVSSTYAALPDSTKKKTMIFCRNYGQAGAVQYYGRNIPQVNSDNGTFLLWMPDTYQQKNIILVAERWPGPDEIVFKQFRNSRVADSVQNSFAREAGVKIFVFENGSDSVSRLIQTIIQQKKSEFMR